MTVAVVTDATSAGEVIALRDGVETKLTDLGAALADVSLRPMTEISTTAPTRTSTSITPRSSETGVQAWGPRERTRGSLALMTMAPR